MDKWYIIKDGSEYVVKYKDKNDGKLYHISPFFKSRLMAIIHAYISRRVLRSKGLDVKIIKYCI